MTSDELTAIGASIYGEHWRRPLALALGVSLRTMQRWAKGELPVNDEVVTRLELLREIARAGRRPNP